MGNMIELNGENFDREALRANMPVLVDFYPPWCGPCKMIAPLLEQLAVEFQGRIRFAKLNVDDALGLAGEYEVSGVPTLAIFRNGQLADKMVGFGGTQALKSFLEEAIAAQAAERGIAVGGRLS